MQKNNTGQKIISDAKIDMGKHVLLTIFTFGIWYLIWVHKTTQFLNNTPGEKKQDPMSQTLLCLFVPFYCAYWAYEQSKKIDKLAKTVGLSSDIALTSMLLSIFVAYFIAPIIMQDKINKIIDISSGVATVQANTPLLTDISKSKAEDLVKFKELLDMGAITEEEFAKMKKEILGI